MIATASFSSPLGVITLQSNGQALIAARFGETPASATPDALLREAIRQLDAYFTGALRSFDLPLELTGTPFQRAVWQQLLSIPYGETRSYSEIARALGKPGAQRAVGAANGANPIVIIVPCHRVIGSGGKLGGYGGGLWRKDWLLRHEGAIL